MPNRWVKANLLTSDRFNSASFEGQSIYVRLLLVADDHGRYDGRVSVLLSACDPLQTFANKCAQTTADQVQKWFTGVLADLEAVDLIRFWAGIKGPVLLIPRFYERPRSKSKFEDPPEELLQEQGCTHLLADARNCMLSTSTTHVHGTRPRVTTHDHETRLPKKASATKVDTVPVWTAYRQAYIARYQQEPTRNVRVNAQLAKFAQLVPLDQAPEIAAFYVRHNKPWYVTKAHPVGLLLADAEGLRTQWLNGRTVTDTEARQGDRTAALGNVFQPLIEEARQRERIANGGK